MRSQNTQSFAYYQPVHYGYSHKNQQSRPLPWKTHIIPSQNNMSYHTNQPNQYYQQYYNWYYTNYYRQQQLQQQQHSLSSDIDNKAPISYDEFIKNLVNCPEYVPNEYDTKTKQNSPKNDDQSMSSYAACFPSQYWYCHVGGDQSIGPLNVKQLKDNFLLNRPFNNNMISFSTDAIMV